MKTIRTATVALLFLTGCTLPLAGSGDGVHVVQPKDIPVPDRMKLSQYGHQSNTLEVGDYRYVNLVYEGDQSVIQVANYLLERMPQHSNRLISQENRGTDTSFSSSGAGVTPPSAPSSAVTSAPGWRSVCGPR